MILAVHDLALFAAAALAVNLTPGPDMLFVAGSSIARGRRAGVLAALGVGAGCMVHVALAALGLSALLAASPLAFEVVKWIGAAYLVWIGVSMLRAPTPRPRDAPPGSAKVFWQGALTNALNPKVALFFLAFLPQFVDAGAPGQGWAFLALGLLFDAGGTLVNVAVALAAGRIRRRFEVGSASRWGPWLRRGVAVAFVGLGLKLAVGSR